MIPCTEQGIFQQLIAESPDSILLVDGEGTIVFANTTFFSLLHIPHAQPVVGSSITRFVSSSQPKSTHITKRITHIIATQTPGDRFEMVLNRTDNAPVHVEVNARWFQWDTQQHAQQPPHQLVQMVLRDITFWKETTEVLQHAHNAASERATRFRALIEMGRDLISTHALSDLLHLALQHATSFSGYDSGSILLFVKPDQTLEVRSSIGKDAVAPGTKVEDLPHSISGRVLDNKQPMILEGHGENVGVSWRTYTKSIPSTVNLPLISTNGTPVGVLTLKSTSSSHTLNADDLDTLQLLASQLAVTVENSQLHEENAHLLKELEQREVVLLDLVERLMTSQEEERRRMAYELHDSLAQVAASAHQHLQSFASSYHPRSAVNRQKLDLALDLAQRVVKETRLIIAGLRPTVLDDFGLASALRHEVNNLRTERWDVTYEETLDTQQQRLPPPIETAFYRVAQEALTNIRKHAGNTPIRLTLHVSSQTIRLEIQDWGCGFHLDHQSKLSSTGGEQIGLVSMYERISLVGGTCRVTSRPGEGTSIVAEAPLRYT
jgi:signal transduction histidine kinase